ncbi:cation diffusion facilitator family transporter [Enterovirga rhinocerotis]|uniref:Protein p34 n=1 Tax=Enterovirga rhinocerotis TaxID=1339210 RepID=A0A4R7C8P4_9HYPH|nr:cation diffusion facilitator family transporter [Enterovirga rhinocerotis]TDR94352.1 cation diffusion facilitator family transporter [Enterovirga rhinocerotis]
MDPRQKLALASIAVAIVVLGLKYAAYHVTGSVALYSDALESIINVATALVAFYAIRVSLQPADADHPYGHTKAEYFSAVFEGALIVVAALLILREAYFAYLAPRQIEAPALGLAINAGASILNAGWAWILIRKGRALRSHALQADGRHLLADVATSIGVLIGLVAAIATGIPQLDPALAALVALNILWAGWQVMRESVGGLMDQAASPDTIARIRELISAHAEGAIEAHDLRTRHAGRVTFLDFHLVVPGTLSVSEAHDICDRIERAVRAEFEGCLVTIHVEPENKAKHSGIVVL